MSSSRQIVTAFLALAAVGTTGWLVLREKPAERQPVPQEKPASMPSSRPPESTPSLLAPHVIAPTKAPVDVHAMVRYPDGSYLPALNGVRGAPAMQWPAGRPFSPVVNKVGTPPNEWYVHADGCMSTTTMTYRSDIQRESPMSHVAEPRPPAPLEVEDPKAPGKDTVK